MKKQKRKKRIKHEKVDYFLSKSDLKTAENAAKTLAIANAQIDKITIPQIEIASNLVKQIQDSYSLQMLESFKKLQEELFAPMVKLQAELTAMTEPLTLFKSLMDAELKNLKVMQDMIFKLPLANLRKQLTISTEFLFEIDSFTPTKKINEYSLSATSISRTDLGIVVFERLDRIEMTLEGIEQKQEKTGQDIAKVLNESEKKDEVIQELVDFVRKNKTALVKIKDIEYNDQRALLMIKGKEISFKRAPNQELLCKIIFINSTDLKKEFLMEDLVKHYTGSDIFSMMSSEKEKVVRKIIDTAYNINAKIEKKTGIKDFFIPTVKQLTINPRVL